jgi:hypothetical protein
MQPWSNASALTISRVLRSPRQVIDQQLGVWAQLSSAFDQGRCRFIHADHLHRNAVVAELEHDAIQGVDVTSSSECGRSCHRALMHMVVLPVTWIAAHLAAGTF